ncbi:MAG: DUF4249 family protein [Saprospiraceae bacterium]
MKFLMSIFITILCFSCESVFEFKQADFVSDIVVTCILDANGPSLINVDQTYPVVGYSELTIPTIDDFEVTLYENGKVTEKLMVFPGENFFETVPKVGYEYHLTYKDKGKEVTSDVVIIPQPLKSVVISEMVVTNSKLNFDTKALEVTILADLDEPTYDFISFRILGKRNQSFVPVNSYDPQRDGLVADPCNEIGIFDSYIVSRNCSIDNKITKYLGAETVFYNNGVFNYREFEIIVESLSKSYKDYLTDINIDSIERAFVPYFSAYSNMSNGIGVMAAKNSKILRVRLDSPPF